MGHYGSSAAHPAAGNPVYFWQGNVFLGYTIQAYLTQGNAAQSSSNSHSGQANNQSNAVPPYVHMSNAAPPYVHMSNAAPPYTQMSNAAQTDGGESSRSSHFSNWGMPHRSRKQTRSTVNVDESDEDRIETQVLDSEHRRLLESRSESASESESDSDEPVTKKRKFTPKEETIVFLKGLTDKPLKNEERKSIAAKFPLLSYDPAHPSKLDEAVVNLIPKSVKTNDRFLSKLW